MRARMPPSSIFKRRVPSGGINESSRERWPVRRSCHHSAASYCASSVSWCQPRRRATPTDEPGRSESATTARWQGPCGRRVRRQPRLWIFRLWRTRITPPPRLCELFGAVWSYNGEQIIIPPFTLCVESTCWWATEHHVGGYRYTLR